MTGLFKAGRYSFPLGEKAWVMGILNYTPDSFSDGGRYFEPSLALERALEMERDGADIIDIGANSTRPGGDILTENEEYSRLEQVLGAVGGRLSKALSVDTFYPSCARLALDAGADIINDVSGIFNTEIALAAKEYGAAYIVTHAPVKAGETADYKDGVIASVKDFFTSCVSLAEETGLGKEHLCLDPGFGFGKTEEENFELLRGMREYAVPGAALLAGLSRKRFTALGVTDPAGRDTAACALNALAICRGADIIRVHNVPAGVITARAAFRSRNGQNHY